jgi:uncharacterized repeat protein (TIGR01451 family)
LAYTAAAGCASCPRIDPTGERVFIWPKDQQRTVAPLLASPSSIVAPPVATDPVFPAPAVAAAAPAAIGAPGVTPASVALAQVPQDKVSITPERILAPVGSEVVLKAHVCTTEGFTLADQKVEWMLGRNGVGQFVEVSGKGFFHPAWLPWNKPAKVDNYLVTGWTAADKLCITRGTADPADDVAIERGDAWVSVTSPNEGTSYVTAYMPTVESWETRRSSATIYWVDVQWTFPPSTVPSDGRSATLTTTVTRQTNGTPIEGWLVRYELADSGGSLSGSAGQVVEVRTDANGQATVQATPTASGAATTPVNVQLIRPAGFAGGDAPRLIVASSTSSIQWGGGSYVPSGSVPSITTPTPVDSGPTTPIPSLGSPPSTGGSTTTPSFPTIPAQRPQLQLELSGDTQALSGGQASLRLRIRNVGTAPATNVRVVDTLDPGLVYPQDVTATEVDATGGAPLTLPPGADVNKPILFNVMRAGRLCHNVRATSAEGAEATAQHCVTATEPPAAREPRVTVRKDAGPGPVIATVGETLHFRVTVANAGDVALVNVRVDDYYPPQFFRVQAAPGEAFVNGAITHVIDRLERGTQRTFDVDAVCIQAAMPVLPKPVVRVTALTDPGSQPVSTAAEVDLEIREANPAAGGAGGPGPPAAGARPPISVVADFYPKPARVGSRTTCEIALVNTTAVDDADVQLVVAIPPQLRPDVASIRTSANVGVTPSGNQLRFDPVRTVRPNERIIFQIPLTVDGPAGIVEISSEVRSRNDGGGAPRRSALEVSNL